MTIRAKFVDVQYIEGTTKSMSQLVQLLQYSWLEIFKNNDTAFKLLTNYESWKIMSQLQLPLHSVHFIEKILS